MSNKKLNRCSNLPKVKIDHGFGIERHKAKFMFNKMNPNKILGILKLCGLALLFTLFVSYSQLNGHRTANITSNEHLIQMSHLDKGGIWSVQKARDWYSLEGWRTGVNYIPSNAVNQLEMWQKETFSPDLIDKEFQLAESIGFNTMRVFLHSIAWKEDANGFKTRIGRFLTIASKHHIKPIFVFFDDCWNKQGNPGKQPAPKVGVHNSGWLQDPGQPASADTAKFSVLEKYVTDILTTFNNDDRVLAWDLYNEPGNSGKGNESLPLLEAVFKWAHGVRPSQPLTAGIWKWSLGKLNAFQIANSDIISYHNYEKPEWHRRVVELLHSYGKPLFCTEYMARAKGSLFKNTMPMLKAENVSAISWGFVEGKTNTKYAWDSPMPNGEEPDLWFHDIFRKNLRPYKQDEVDLIKKLNGKI